MWYILQSLESSCSIQLNPTHLYRALISNPRNKKSHTGSVVTNNCAYPHRFLTLDAGVTYTLGMRMSQRKKLYFAIKPDTFRPFIMKLLMISDKHMNKVFVCFWLCFLISPIVFCSSLEHRTRGQMLLCAPKQWFPLQSRTGLQGYIHISFK